jgi:hypothetical protein
MSIAVACYWKYVHMQRGACRESWTKNMVRFLPRTNVEEKANIFHGNRVCVANCLFLSESHFSLLFTFIPSPSFQSSQKCCSTSLFCPSKRRKKKGETILPRFIRSRRATPLLYRFYLWLSLYRFIINNILTLSSFPRLFSSAICLISDTCGEFFI